ncbi:uncharacterized protein C1orf112 homolog [Bicyclus anynana]|uniref:Uncharacterized protein C1orf112 homolog n=1 Tax=Bicyclus anynana TaxID=110368 RepID=A0A6J1NXB6_BICAN|nr:uncharacterized protein C1orf112 homolog [Bicyclus anynana]
MDNSQSSDIFPGTNDNLNFSTSEREKYFVLVSKIKLSAQGGVDVLDISEEKFTILLEDCNTCIDQGLSLIVPLLEDASTHLNELRGYIENAASILQILSNFIKSVMESVSITVKTVNNFSTYTGNIILSVFTHCKDSECIYGGILNAVQKQLKDLFKNCHELQMIYLMALEKQYLFDLSEKEHQDILLKTLEINLKISDVVQSLDVKTMAEQWKAYTIICEKYSSFLLEKHIFNLTSKLLVSTIENNLNTALEAKEDKTVLRSLKVANFSFKILLRICNTFKGSDKNNYEDVLKLLLYVGLCNSSYYEVTANKSSDFSALLSTHTSMPLELIVASLINEEQFLKLIFFPEDRKSPDTQMLGFVLLVIIIMKIFLEKEDEQSMKVKVIGCVFSVLPYCHKWFNIGLKFKYSTQDGTKYCGLYEYLLLHTVALSSTLRNEQYNILENYLYEALLGTECYKAMFASNLWVLLCRLSDQLHLEVLLGLIKVHQKLETHGLFLESPQKVHLSYTIEKLLETLNNEGKIQIYKQFSVKDKRNVAIWCALKLKNLPNDISKSIHNGIINNLSTNLNEVLNGREESLDDLIKYTLLASSYPLTERNPRLEDYLLSAWLRLCPECSNILQFHHCLLYRYLKALSSLTICYANKIDRQEFLAKIQNIISKILLTENNDIFHLLFKLFCKLSLIKTVDNFAIRSIFTDTVTNLLEHCDIQPYIFHAIVSDDNISKLLMPVLKQSKSNNFIDFKNKLSDIEEWHKQLDLNAKNKYIHKCIDNEHTDRQTFIGSEIQENIREKKNNFDVGDIQSLFEGTDIEEPLCKKAKLDFNIDNLIRKIESDVEQLSQVKENVLSEYKVRIISVCNKLRNIIS